MKRIGLLGCLGLAALLVGCAMATGLPERSRTAAAVGSTTDARLRALEAWRTQTDLKLADQASRLGAVESRVTDLLARVTKLESSPPPPPPPPPPPSPSICTQTVTTTAEANSAAQAAVPGTVICFAPGIYGAIVSPASGTAAARIRFVSMTKWAAKIVATSGIAWDNRGWYVDIDGFEITGPAASMGVLQGGGSVRVIGNHIHHFLNQGIDDAIVDYLHGHNEYKGNLVHDISGTASGSSDGYGIYSAQDSAIVVNNVVYRIQAYGLHFWHAANNLVVANNLTFSTGKSGIILGSGDGGVGTLTNSVIANNVIVDATDPTGYGIRDCCSGQFNIGPSVQYLNNWLYRSGGLLKRIGTESGTQIGVDPKFVNYQPDGSGDYRLAIGSPAIDAGTSLGAPTTDFSGVARPQGAAVDVGPYEQ